MHQKIPKKIKIGGHLLTIKYSDNENEMGLSDTRANRITIDSKLPPGQKMATLIHEALHIMNTTMSGSHTGHMLLDSLSEQIYAFLIDNKLLK